MAKLCSIKGADVTITYKTQFTLALNIKKEILANGGKIKLIKLDVLDKNVLKKINQKYDQIYYFATPKIISNLKKQISPDLLKEYNLFYVQVFKKIVEKYKRLNKNIKFFYPSTIYIEEKNKKFREYWIAKKEGEKLCHMFNRNIKGLIISLRLPPLDTDQNLSIIPMQLNSTFEYALKIIETISVKNKDL